MKTWKDLEAEMKPITWLWEKWLPSGHLVIIAGESGAGKSAIALRVASCFVHRDSWLDGTPFEGEHGSVLWCEAEEAQATNLDRAQKWELPREKIVSLFDDDLFAEVNLDLKQHQAAILEKLKLAEIKFCIVDSLSGAHKGNENSSRTIAIVKGLAQIARDTGKPILLTHHLRKRGLFDGGKTISLDRLRGSSAIVQPARVVWAIDTPDGNPEHKRLSVIKSNLSTFPKAIGFTITENSIDLSAPPEVLQRETQTERLSKMIPQILTSGPKPVGEIQAEVEQAGLSWASAQKVKEKLHIDSQKQGDTWLWQLPSTI
jgi:RecA-family ATPase